MKVILVNGSPHQEGCTYTALSETASALEKEGIGTQIFQLGTEEIHGCIACGKCREKGKCVFDDKVNEFTALAESSDGFVFGSPVYYASPNGALLSFLDRVFYSSGAKLAYKPAAAVVSARRAGTTASLEVLQKYLSFNNMPIVSSQYWCMVHGFTAEDARKDLEGMQIMRRLGRNMAWLLKCIDAGKQAGVTLPHIDEEHIFTNFIR